MRANQDYLLKEITGIYYLLPYGQNIADLKRGIRINETGAYIWTLLQNEQDPDTLLDCLAHRYQAFQKDRAVLEKDMGRFLNLLRTYGMLLDDSLPEAANEPCFCCLKIGGLHISLCGPEPVFSKDFFPYRTDLTDHGDLNVQVHIGAPRKTKNGPLILRNRELIICDLDREYLILFPKAEQIVEAHLSKEGSRIDFYCRPPFSESLAADLFHAIRLAFLYLAQKHGLFALHSASVLYKERAWLFAGHSGMGKSTHVKLWNRLYGVPVLNGDLNLLVMEKGVPKVCGTPWCGTSGISDPQNRPLGGIILLGRSVDNVCEELSPDEKALLIMQRLISPSWTEELFDRNLAFSEELAAHTAVCRLRCNKEPSAAKTAKAWVDHIQPGPAS